MFALMTGWLLVALAAIGGEWRPSRVVSLHDPFKPDLPCPWCRTQTTEEDSVCNGCGRTFG